MESGYFIEAIEVIVAEIRKLSTLVSGGYETAQLLHTLLAL
jgi:hypothetical protein